MILQPGECTLKDWIKEAGMSGRCQSVLISAFRGADADDSPEVKRVVRWIRKQCYKDNNPKSHFMRDCDFIRIKALIEQDSWQWDRLKSHFYDHMKQALEVIAYFHPDKFVNDRAEEAYKDLSEHESIGIEEKPELIARLKDEMPIAIGEWVIQDWVLQLPGKAQSALLCGIRGSDIATDEEVRKVSHWLRWVICKDVMPSSHYMQDKEFMRIKDRLAMYPSSWGNLPIHFRHHTREALEIVGYMHADSAIAERARTAYEDLCNKAKGKPESKDVLVKRMQDTPGRTFETVLQRTNSQGA